MELGLLIKQKRIERGLTQPQLGKMVGVSKVTISKYEKGIIQNMKRDKIKRLAEILDIPIMYFLDKEMPDQEVEQEIVEIISPEEFEREVKLLLKKANFDNETKSYFTKKLEAICDEDN